jgi:hypothetical protein
VLVQFQPGHIPDLAFFGRQAELWQLFGHPVDLTRSNLCELIIGVLTWRDLHLKKLSRLTFAFERKRR